MWKRKIALNFFGAREMKEKYAAIGLNRIKDMEVRKRDRSPTTEKFLSKKCDLFGTLQYELHGEGNYNAEVIEKFQNTGKESKDGEENLKSFQGKIPNRLKKNRYYDIRLDIGINQSRRGSGLMKTTISGDMGKSVDGGGEMIKNPIFKGRVNPSISYLITSRAKSKLDKTMTGFAREILTQKKKCQVKKERRGYHSQPSLEGRLVYKHGSLVMQKRKESGEMSKISLSTSYNAILPRKEEFSVPRKVNKTLEDAPLKKALMVADALRQNSNLISKPITKSSNKPKSKTASPAVSACQRKTLASQHKKKLTPPRPKDKPSASVESRSKDILDLLQKSRNEKGLNRKSNTDIRSPLERIPMLKEGRAEGIYKLQKVEPPLKYEKKLVRKAAQKSLFEKIQGEGLQEDSKPLYKRVLKKQQRPIRTLQLKPTFATPFISKSQPIKFSSEKTKSITPKKEKKTTTNSKTGDVPVGSIKDATMKLPWMQRKSLTTNAMTDGLLSFLQDKEKNFEKKPTYPYKSYRKRDEKHDFIWKFQDRLKDEHKWKERRELPARYDVQGSLSIGLKHNSLEHDGRPELLGVNHWNKRLLGTEDEPKMRRGELNHPFSWIENDYQVKSIGVDSVMKFSELRRGKTIKEEIEKENEAWNPLLRKTSSTISNSRDCSLEKKEDSDYLKRAERKNPKEVYYDDLIEIDDGLLTDSEKSENDDDDLTELEPKLKRESLPEKSLEEIQLQELNNRVPQFRRTSENLSNLENPQLIRGRDGPEYGVEREGDVATKTSSFGWGLDEGERPGMEKRERRISLYTKRDRMSLFERLQFGTHDGKKRFDFGSKPTSREDIDEGSPWLWPEDLFNKQDVIDFQTTATTIPPPNPSVSIPPPTQPGSPFPPKTAYLRVSRESNGEDESGNKNVHYNQQRHHYYY